MIPVMARGQWLGLFLWGCQGAMASEAPPSPPGSMGATDAQLADSGVMDAGGELDAGPRDGGLTVEDAASEVDAGPPALAPLRVIFVRTVGPAPTKEDWMPTGGARDFELAPIHEPLTPYRDRLVLIEGTDHSKYPDRRHENDRDVRLWQGGSITTLTGSVEFTRPARRDDYMDYRARNRSLDWVLRDKLAPQSPWDPVLFAADQGLVVRIDGMIIRGRGRPPSAYLSWQATDAGFAAASRVVEWDNIDERYAELQMLFPEVRAPAFGRQRQERVDAQLQLLLELVRRDLQRVFVLDLVHLAEILVAAPGCNGDTARYYRLMQDAHRRFGGGHCRPEPAAQRWRDERTHFAADVARLVVELEKIPAAGGSVWDRTLIVWLEGGGFTGPTVFRNFRTPALLLAGRDAPLDVGQFLQSCDEEGDCRPHLDLLRSVAEVAGLEEAGLPDWLRDADRIEALHS